MARRFFLHADPHRDEPLLTTEQVRARLGLGSIDAVYRLVKHDGLPRIVVGRVYRFRPSDVATWLEGQNASLRRVG